MYDVKNRKWKSDCENEDLLRWSQEPANAAQPEAQFIRASALLEKNRRGGDVAEAVALMEAAAESDYPEAVFAMRTLLMSYCFRFLSMLHPLTASEKSEEKLHSFSFQSGGYGTPQNHPYLAG